MKKSTQSRIEKIGLGPEERELKLGSSFTNPRECAFHTLRYDFKPASVDTNKMATIDVGTNSQITVTVPPNLIYKGSAKPYQKQCIGIIDPETGYLTLERLHSNIQVKKIRSENKMSPQKMSMIDQYIMGQKPKKPSNKSSKNHSVNNTATVNNNSNKSNMLKQPKKSNNKSDFPVASNMNNLLHMHSNSAKISPNSQARFPSGLSPSNASPSKSIMEDQAAALDEWFNSVDSNRSAPIKQDVKKVTPKEGKDDMMGYQETQKNGFLPFKEEPKFPVVKSSTRLSDEVGELSDSSSSCSSSSSGDSSDSSSDTESQPKKKACQNEHLNNASPDPEDLLKEDLQLSESGSDSD